MTQPNPFLLAATVAALSALPTASAVAATPPAKITKAQARTIALKAAPGVVQDAEYEKEGGGWRYSFDIRQGTRIHEIGVDATSGRIVEDKFESRNDKD